MRSFVIARSVLLAGALLCAEAALPHHSNVAFEVNKIIMITGVVKEFRWMNPHTWLYVIADDGAGGKIEWACEGRPPGILRRAGWSKNVVQAGEKVTVYMSPAKDGTKSGLVARVVKADGTVLANAPPPQE